MNTYIEETRYRVLDLSRKCMYLRHVANQWLKSPSQQLDPPYGNPYNRGTFLFRSVCMSDIKLFHILNNIASEIHGTTSPLEKAKPYIEAAFEGR